MALFMVSYDLHLDREYDDIIDALRRGGGVRLLESLWLIQANSTAEQLRVALEQQVDDDDAIAVIQLKPGSDWAAVNAMDAGVKWLRRHVAP